MQNLNQFLEYLGREGLKYHHDEDSNLVTLDFGGDHGSYRILIQITEGSLLQAYGLPGIKVPMGAVNDVALAVTRANYALKLGKFELDLNDGELRFHIAVPFDEYLPADSVLDQCVHVGVAMLDRYLPAFLSVIYGNEPAKSAIEMVEQAP